MKKLLNQILKFGLVGIICFFIDFFITVLVAKVFRAGGMSAANAATVSAFFGFVVSVVVNYLLSMKYVFVRREDMSRRREFIIFIILSVIGLGINEIVIWGCMTMIANIGWCAAFTAWCQKIINFFMKGVSFDGMATAGSKVIATAIVMVWNFVSRKKWLEQHEEDQTEA